MQVSAELHGRGYRLGPRLGKGSYAKVKLAERLADDQTVAIKIINKRRAAKEFIDKFMPRELSIHLRIQHNNIIRMYEVIHQAESVCVVMEYAAQGDLLDFVKRRGWLLEGQAGRVFHQVCQGLSFLHASSICHRDLKCENILLRHDLTAALSDFGFARTLQGRDTVSQTYCGSAAYASPELLRGRPYRPLGNDVWSLGCVLFIMVTGQMPFYDKNTKKMLYRQMKGTVSYPEHLNVSASCRDVIRHILEPNTMLRWDVDTILSHPWLTESWVSLPEQKSSTNPEISTALAPRPNLETLPESPETSSKKVPATSTPSKPTTDSPTDDASQTFNQIDSGSQSESAVTSADGGQPEDAEEASCQVLQNTCPVSPGLKISTFGSLLSVSSFASDDDRSASLMATGSGMNVKLSLCRMPGRECILPSAKRVLSSIGDSENEKCVAVATCPFLPSKSPSVDAFNSSISIVTSTATRKEPARLVGLGVDFKKTIKKILQIPSNASDRLQNSDRANADRGSDLPSGQYTVRQIPKSVIAKIGVKIGDEDIPATYDMQETVKQHQLNPDSHCIDSSNTAAHGLSSTAEPVYDEKRIDDRDLSATYSQKTSLASITANSQSEFSAVPVSEGISSERTYTRREGLVTQMRRIFESRDASTSS